LSLDLLLGFRVAARHLSFTRAAQELHVTQSAISREIKTLEEQIGQALFHRVHRALQLTRAGEELYRAADEALSHLDAVTDRLAGAGRTLAVQTTTGLASLWLAPRLPRFNRLHPQIDVRASRATTSPISSATSSTSRSGSRREGRTLLQTASGCSSAGASRSARQRSRATRRTRSGAPPISRTTCGSSTRRSATVGGGRRGISGSTR
jgi:hypothetical protein